MGMFDHLRCDYPLPVEGANDIDYQTKDTDEQYLDNYVIRADGTLWHEEYDIEDHSDPNATGIERIFGCMARVRERWVQEETFTGEIRFYAYQPAGFEWIEFSAYFVKGALQSMNLIRADKAETAEVARASNAGEQQ